MSGLDLDHALLYQARKFITAANVHYVKTCIFCYEISVPHSQHRQRYERLLREFVGSEIHYWQHGRSPNWSVVVRTVRMRRANHWMRIICVL